jgi:hypothetical protein
VHIWIKKFIHNLPLAQPTSKQDIERLKKSTFYSFVNNPSKLKTLHLDDCGTKYDNWFKHPERLEGLLAAMAKTRIKHSLKIIYVHCCGVSEKQVREMVEKHGFTNIKKIYANW